MPSDGKIHISRMGLARTSNDADRPTIARRIATALMTTSSGTKTICPSSCAATGCPYGKPGIKQGAFWLGSRLRAKGSPHSAKQDVADLGAQVFRIGGDRAQGFGAGAKQDVVKHSLAMVGKRRDRLEQQFGGREARATHAQENESKHLFQRRFVAPLTEISRKKSTTDKCDPSYEPKVQQE